MIYTLVFGARVETSDGHHGTLKRIILNNGIADQFTVHPAGLFSGPERVIPISDVVSTTPELIKLRADEDEWKAYNALNTREILSADPTLEPTHLPASAESLLSEKPLEGPTIAAAIDVSTMDQMSVILTDQTLVGDDNRLLGLVTETGIPQQLLIEGGQIPFEQVGIIDETHIKLGPPLPNMDEATPPSSIGQDQGSAAQKDTQS